MAETNGHNGKPPAVTPPGGNGNGAGNGGGGVVSKVLAGAKSVQARATEEIKETIKAPENQTHGEGLEHARLAAGNGDMHFFAADIDAGSMGTEDGEWSGLGIHSKSQRGARTASMVGQTCPTG